MHDDAMAHAEAERMDTAQVTIYLMCAAHVLLCKVQILIELTCLLTVACRVATLAASAHSGFFLTPDGANF